MTSQPPEILTDARKPAKRFLTLLKAPYLSRWLPLLLLVALVLVPAVVESRYILHLMIMWGIYAMLTLSLTVITGFSGQLAFGQAAFYGIGAYASAILVQQHAWPFLGAFLVAGLLALVIGGALAIPFQRLYGIYLGMATFGFGEIAHLVFRNWESVTSGALGIKDIPAPVIFNVQFSDQHSYFYLVLGVLLIVVVLVLRLARSSAGQALLAIRDDELAASTLGIPTMRYKVAAFALGSAIAGFAGSLFAHYITYLSPENFTLRISILLITMLIVGGRSNVLGALAGAAILVTLPEVLRIVPSIRILVYGALLITVAILRPRGILGNFRWGQEPPTWQSGEVERRDA